MRSWSAVSSIFFLLVFFMQSLGMLGSLVGVYQSGCGLVEDRAAASDFVNHETVIFIIPLLPHCSMIPAYGMC